MFVDSVIKALVDTLPDTGIKKSLHEPMFFGNELANLKECIDTGWVSSAGKFVDKFEDSLSQYTGVRNAIAVVNGTSALHICLKLAGVNSGDEVLVPVLTFIATANAAVYCGAVPHFIDIEERTLGVDPYKLDKYLDRIGKVENGELFNRESGRRISVLIAVHTFGHPVDVDPLLEVCEKHNIKLIEDAAESLGSFYKGRQTGSFGFASALSFNGNKIITCGGGGAVLTNSDEKAKVARHIVTQAKRSHKWEYYHDQTGYNYRLPNINAALGLAQLEKLPDILRMKRALAKRYQKYFAEVKGAGIFIEAEFVKSNYWLNTLILDKGFEDLRDTILEKTNKNGFMTRPAWILLTKLPMFKDSSAMDISCAQSLESRIINIPSSAFLGKHACPEEKS